MPLKNFTKHHIDYSYNLVGKNMHKSNKKLRECLIKKGKIYHGCMNRNKNGTKKLIDFKGFRRIEYKILNKTKCKRNKRRI